MKRRIPEWVDWVAVLIALGCAAVLMLTGCGSPVPRSHGNGETGVPGGPTSVIHGIALVASGLAGAALLGCAVAAVFAVDKFRVAKTAVACVVVLVVAQLLYWIGDHLKIAAGLAALALALGAVGWAWVHRKAIEKRTGIDFNRDGRLG